MEKEIEKYTRTFRHAYKNELQLHCNKYTHKQKRQITKYLLIFQYQTTIDVLNIKIRNVMSSLQVQCTSHARILKCHYQYRHSKNQDMFNIFQYIHNQNKKVPAVLYSIFLLHHMHH